MSERAEIGKVQTFSLIAGSRACDGRCPFCISKMTPNQGMNTKADNIDWNRFKRASQYATDGKTETAMITGKGEPVLFPDHISGYLNGLLEAGEKLGYKIPVKELQTNGIAIADGKVDNLLHLWRAGGLQTIAVSIVHFDPEENRKIYLPYRDRYINLPGLIDKLHSADYTVRLACVLFKGGIDSAEKVKKLVEFAKDNQVEQLTIRPVNKPGESQDGDVAKWVEEHSLEQGQLQKIDTYLRENGVIVKEFPFGGTVYSIHSIGSQNVCFTSCLTKDEPRKYLRQLIYYPNGRIALDWTEKGEGLK